jgi:hypothetical protein
MLHSGKNKCEANPIGTASQHSSPCAKPVSAEDELLRDHFSSSFDAAPNGRIVDPSCRHAGGNVLVGVHLLVFESARFTLEASCCSECGSREHLSLPGTNTGRSEGAVECRYRTG